MHKEAHICESFAGNFARTAYSFRRIHMDACSISQTARVCLTSACSAQIQIWCRIQIHLAKKKEYKTNRIQCNPF